MATTPEGKVKDKIKRFLKLYKIDYWMPVPSAMGNTTGMSDFIAILRNGKFLAIEAKSPDKRNNVSANQQRFLDAVNVNNGHGIVVANDDDLIALEVWLKHYELG